MPAPPPEVLADPGVRRALAAYERHLRIVTPFKVDVLAGLLDLHPNRPLVESVLRGLREGFWPLAGGRVDPLPDVGDYDVPADDLAELRKAEADEVAAGRWSGPIGAPLPGVVISPTFVVRGNRPRAVIDHTASMLNEDITPADAHVRLDTLASFGQELRHAARDPSSPLYGKDLVVWKTDHAHAYSNLPVHPAYQLRQAVRVDGRIRLVRVLCFGSRGSPRVWITVASLLNWLHTHFGGGRTHVYVDDHFGLDSADAMVSYAGRHMPAAQAKLLLLLDEVGAPWSATKQVWGRRLRVLGIAIDLEKGTFELDDEQRADLAASVERFLAAPARSAPLKDWLRLLGRLNWALQVVPWAKVALASSYQKVADKSSMGLGVHINIAVRDDLTWLASEIRATPGVSFLYDGLWPSSEADLIVHTDATPVHGLGFTYGERGFYYPLAATDGQKRPSVFFVEFMAVLSAFTHVAALPEPPARLLMMTDSSNVVGAVDSLRSEDASAYAVLRAFAELAIRSGIDVRVRHIAGVDNTVADLLSRRALGPLQEYITNVGRRLSVSPFLPPRSAIAEEWRHTF